jgi:hypothetical protein
MFTNAMIKITTPKKIQIKKKRGRVRPSEK